MYVLMYTSTGCVQLSVAAQQTVCHQRAIEADLGPAVEPLASGTGLASGPVIATHVISAAVPGIR